MGFQCFELELGCEVVLTGLTTVLMSCGMATHLGGRAGEPPSSKEDSLSLCDEQAFPLTDIKTLGKGQMGRVLVLRGEAEPLCPPGSENVWW